MPVNIITLMYPKKIIFFLFGSHDWLMVSSYPFAVGLREDWLKLLLSKICIEGSYFSSIFFKLHSHPCVKNNDIVTHLAYQFVSEQAHLLSILSEILNEQLEHIVVSHVFALSIFGILKSAAVVVDFSNRER